MLPVFLSGETAVPICYVLNSNSLYTATDQPQTFNVLADIDCGPAIIEYDSMVTVHFNITELYPQTM